MKIRIDRSGAARLAAGVAAIAGLSGGRLSARTPDPADPAAARAWFADHFSAPAAPPLSFIYEGRPSREFLPGWAREERDRRLDSSRTERTVSWTDPAGALRIECVAVAYDDYPALEWTVYLQDIGHADTGLIEEIEGLDAVVRRDPGGEFTLHCHKGDWNTADSYEPYDLVLPPGSREEFAPRKVGKSCDGPRGWPYFNLQMPGRGILLAIGWPGQWSAAFLRDRSAGLRIEAGQELTHLRLRPGERIRTPLTALVFWRGSDPVSAQNLWRRWFLSHVTPPVHGRPPRPIAQTHVGGGVDDIPRVAALLDAGIHLDACWRDAEANGGGDGPTWWANLGGPYRPGPDQPRFELWWNSGTWEIDPVRYPKGFRPFSDWAHSRGLAFILWFEPERVGSPNSWLGKNHRDWLLPSRGPLTWGEYPSHDPILDEGNPAARRWLIEHVGRLIVSQGLDWYREDMNGAGPLPAWRANDGEDRQGITENFYVQGHLAFWDELLRRHPGLRIDSCASGGRRNDLETMRRAVPLHRCDFNGPNTRGVIEATQGHTYGISSWIPFYGLSCRFDDPYAYRSFYMPSFGILAGNLAVKKKAYAECRRIGDCLLGDYYPLTAYNRNPDGWIAWQFDRPDLRRGVVQAFRRGLSPMASIRVRLRGLEAGARYEVEDFDAGKEIRTGAELAGAGLEVAVRRAPAAALIAYRRLP